jgi:hypothetical protein
MAVTSAAVVWVRELTGSRTAHLLAEHALGHLVRGVSEVGAVGIPHTIIEGERVHHLCDVAPGHTEGAGALGARPLQRDDGVNRAGEAESA